MKFIYSLLFVIVLFSSCVPMDEDSPSPSDVFVKYYGSGDTEAIDVVRVSTLNLGGDSIENFIILAEQADDFFLIKVDENGNQIISSSLDPMGNGSVDVPKKIKPLNNGQFLIVGYTIDLDDADSVDGVWFKINDDLRVDGDFHQLPDVYLTDIVQTLESDAVEKVVVLGHTRKKLKASDQATDFQLYLSKMSMNLPDSIYWEALNGFSSDEESLAIFENRVDSSLMVIGSSEDPSEGKNLYVVQTNSLGTADLGSFSTGIEGAQTDADETPYDVVSTSLGYSVVGSTFDNTGRLAGFHVAFNTSGQLISSASHVLISSYDLPFQAFGVTKTIDNQLMVVGSIPSFTGVASPTENRSEEALLMKVNALSGRLQDRDDQSFGTDVGSDRAKAVITLPDGDIMVAATFDFGLGTTLVGLMRLNSEGELKN